MFLCFSIDLTISRVFDADNGLLAFLKKSLPKNKLFKDANSKSLQFFQKLIQDHPTKSKPYAAAIIQVGMRWEGEAVII